MTQSLISQLSQKLSLVGRAGREASSELRYTLRFD